MDYRIILVLLLVFACQSKSARESVDSTAAHIDTVAQTVSVEQKPDPSTSETRTEDPKKFKGTEWSLEDLDTVFQNAFSKFHDANLSPIIHPKHGAYWIADGAGVYPSVKEIKSSKTLSDCNEYFLFINLPVLINGYFENPEGLDNCNPQMEGVFIYSAKDTQLIYKAYQSQLTATGETISEVDAQRFHKLDAAISKHLIINEPSKGGELNKFEMYFALIDGKLYLAAIDTRSCGI